MIRDSMQIELKKLKNTVANHSRISQSENYMEELEELQARTDREVEKEARQKDGRKCKVLHDQEE